MRLRQFHSCLQFDPTSFVDGLLGIGAAGGGGDTSSSNEGAMLAARLAEMRRERDMRATTKVQRLVVANTASSNASVSAEQVRQPIQKPNRPGSRKKKSKK
jgi:hypothetical protein